MMDIFEYTAASLGCVYISDLRYIRITHSQADKIRALPEKSFPLADYNRLAEYVTGNHTPFPSIAEAKGAIVQSLLFSSV